ncbi:MAG: biopolymer transporter ExbD [Planctomycetes bacterium]|nr:biopolymer transporter ExbD [Planctomycetota bacterium]
MLFERVKPLIDSSINIAPLIDVMFQLILFFMLTSDLNENFNIDIEPPSSKEIAAQSSQSEALIKITKDNSLYFKTERVDFERLTKLLDLHYSSEMKPATVLADKDSSLWPTLQILNYCQVKRYKIQYLINKNEK